MEHGSDCHRPLPRDDSLSALRQGTVVTRLERAEANELASGIALEAAKISDARPLFVKGTSLTYHRLRPDRVSADVDVLVEPTKVDTFLAKLAEFGWHPRLGEYNDFPVRHHSVTVIHDDWPCDIDVHRRFPGFLADPVVAFEELWRRRQSMHVAGHDVPITDYSSSAVIMALHSVRSTVDNPRHTSELVRLIEISREWDDQQRADIAAVAARTGATRALQDVLPLLGVTARPDEVAIDDEALQAWQLRVTGQETPLRIWLRYASEGVGVRDTLGRIWRALWPAEDFFLATHPEAVGSPNWGRLRRLARNIARAPGALLGMAGAHRDNVTQRVVGTLSARNDRPGLK